MSSILFKVYKFGQVPAALGFGYLAYNNSEECKQPQLLSIIGGVTCGIVGSFVWPISPFVYGYMEYKDNLKIDSKVIHKF